VLRRVERSPGSGRLHQILPLARKALTRLSVRDRFAAAALRLGIGRNKAAVGTGLYFTGSPSADSPVLVTANYRLSFDALRKELAGIDAWILAIDTKGVNVWCAAGKGTFCAREVARKVRSSGLDAVAPGAPLVLPQLSASGVNANELRKTTGRRVVFGPVRARDIPSFLASGMKKTQAMREVRFTLADRAILIPVELVHAWPAYLASLFAPLALSLPLGSGFATRWAAYAAYMASSVSIGTIIVPLFLPYLIGRFFSVRSLLPFACLSALAAYCAHGFNPETAAGGPDFHAVPSLAAFLMSGAAAAYFAMIFTGSSTFTNQKGTELEVRRSLPLIAISAAAGAVSAAVWAIIQAFSPIVAPIAVGATAAAGGGFA